MARRELRRGDIRWYRFSSPDKRRPVLILGRDSLLRSVSAVPVIPFSTQVRGLPWEVVLNPNEGLGVASALKPGGFAPLRRASWVPGSAASQHSDGKKFGWP
jgi:mRNA-degrading endonuclease toxin of MazEF toxin-antitoxin module